MCDFDFPGACSAEKVLPKQSSRVPPGAGGPPFFTSPTGPAEEDILNDIAVILNSPSPHAPSHGPSFTAAQDIGGWSFRGDGVSHPAPFVVGFLL